MESFKVPDRESHASFVGRPDELLWIKQPALAEGVLQIQKVKRHSSI
jgi:hypothetical protein